MTEYCETRGEIKMSKTLVKGLMARELSIICPQSIHKECLASACEEE